MHCSDDSVCARINIPSFCSTILVGLFSDVLNYVLRMSKDSSLTPVSSDADSEEGAMEGAVKDEVKMKQRSFIRQRKTVISDDRNDRTDVEMVCIECFKFLKALAKEYSEVQERYW